MTDRQDLEKGLSAARSAALVCDETASFGALVVRGGDRVSWLNGLVTADVTKLAPGHALYGLAVTPKGRVLTDLFFVDEGEHVLLLLPMSEVAAVAAAFEHYLVMEDVELEPAPEAYRVFFVYGPKAAAVLERGKASKGTAAYVDRFGLGGGVVVAQAAAGADVERALGAAATEVGGALGDETIVEALRLERGIPRFGRDFGPSTYPQEAGLETRAVSFDKGCYLGQEVVCMLQLRGHVKRKLVPVVIDEGQVAPGAPVTTADGQAIGELTSAGESAVAGRTLGLAMLKLAFTSPGTELRIGEARAHVSEPV